MNNTEKMRLCPRAAGFGHRFAARTLQFFVALSVIGAGNQPAHAQQQMPPAENPARSKEPDLNQIFLVLKEYSSGEGMSIPRLPSELHNLQIEILPYRTTSEYKFALTARSFESEAAARVTMARIQQFIPSVRVARASEFFGGANPALQSANEQSAPLNSPSSFPVVTQPSAAPLDNTQFPKFRQLLGETLPVQPARRKPGQFLEPRPFVQEAPNPLQAPASQVATLPSPQSSAQASTPSGAVRRAEIVSNLVVDVSTTQVPANGRDRIAVVVRIPEHPRDAVVNEHSVHVTVSGAARLVLEDQPDDALPQNAQQRLRNTSSALQLPAKGGAIRLWVIAPSVPEEAILRVNYREQVADVAISFVPELREFIAVGLVEGVISSRNLSANAIQPLGSRLGFEEDLRRWGKEFGDGKGNASGRAALFVKGSIRGDVLLTASYDSDKVTHSRLMRDIDPQLEYPVYGDSSLRGFDARSASPLYVRIDKNKSYVLWGDFSTTDVAVQALGDRAGSSLVPRKIGAYGRLATGLKVHDEAPGRVVNGFITYDSLRNRTEQYPLNGTTILPGLGSSDAVVNSEQISIVTYDRNLLSTVLSQRLLERNKDYVFEPFNGRVRLLGSDLNFVDENGNPRYIRISYEVDANGGKQHFTYGADGQIAVTPNLNVGGSAVKDENPQQPYQLLSANATVKMGARSAGVVEVAQSEASGVVEPSGRFSPRYGGAPGALETRRDEAVRVALKHEGDGWQANLQVQKAGASFHNPTIDSGAGKTDARASLSVRATDTVTATLDATHVQDDVQPGTPARNDVALGATVKVSDTLQVRVGVRHIQEDAALANTPFLPPNYGPDSGQGAISNGITDTGLGGSIGTGLANGLTSPVPVTRDVDAVTMRVGVDWKPTKELQLGAEAEAGTDTLRDQQVSRWMLTSNYRFNDQLRGIARYEHSDGLGSALSLNQGDRSDVFTAGLRADVGAQTQMYSEYRLRDAASGETLEARDMQLASGIRQGYYVAPGVQLNGNAEYLKIYEGNAREAYALGVGMDHTANPLWKMSTRVDWRHVMDTGLSVGDQSEDQYSWTISLARKLDRDWTYLVRNYLLVSDYRNDSLGMPRGDVLQNRFQMGLAWRPVDTNPWNALMRYEYRTSWDDSAALLPPSSGAVQAMGVGDQYRAHIVSLVADYHPSRPWWWTGRLAALAREDRIPETGIQNLFSAYLMSSRLTYDYSKRWDISGLAAQMYSPESRNSQYALGFELGYLVQANLRLGLGYNFGGFSAPDLSGSDYTQNGLYVRMSFKFDEKLFKSADPEVNRSLARDGAAAKTLEKKTP